MDFAYDDYFIVSMARVFTSRMKDVKIVIPSVKWTKDGENQTLIEKKAEIFVEQWEKYLGGAAFEVPKSIRKKIKEDAKAAKVVMDDVEIRAWLDLEALFGNQDRFKWLKQLHEHGLSVTHCKEDDIRGFLTAYLAESSVTKKVTVSKMISEMRSALRSIGRERHVSSVQSEVRFAGKSYLDPRNPVTESLAEEIIKGFTRAANRKRVGDDHSGDSEGDDDEREDAVSKEPVTTLNDPEATEKMGFPVSVVGAYVAMLHFLAEAVTKYVRWQRKELSDNRQIANLCNLVLMFALCIHEGTRPGDVQRGLAHKHFKVIGHKVIYALTLVFIKPATYAYLCRYERITQYCGGFYKGKKQKAVAERLKKVIPCAYNSLDLLHIYVLCMRVVFAMLPTEVLCKKQHVFRSVNLTSLRSRKCKHIGFSDVTFYSLRYGGAEEDQKAHVPDHWTRMRMGHTSISNVKDEYAANKDKRAMIGEERMELGMDHITTDACNTIPLHFSPVQQGGLVFDTDWLDAAFKTDEHGADEADSSKVKAFRKDFVSTAKLVRTWIEKKKDGTKEGKEKAKEAYDKLMAKHDDIPDDWYNEIPLGLNLSLPDVLCPPSLRSIHDDAVKALKGVFDEVDVPSKVPELYSFPQVFYGDWRVLIGESTQAKVFIAPSTDEQNKKRKRKNGSQGGASKKKVPTPVPESDTNSEEASDLDQPTRFPYDRMEKGSVAVIFCSNPDACAMPVKMDDGTTHHVWIAKVTEHVEDNDGSYKIIGVFMHNATKVITEPLNLRTSDRVFCKTVHDILEVYTYEKHFALNEFNVKGIKAALAKAVHS